MRALLATGELEKMDFLNIRKNFSKIFFILTLFSFIGLASASIPQLIAFQGKLTDKNGALINGSTAMTFNIYTTSTGGSSLYTETQTINVQDGLVSALIGSVTALTLPFDQQYYLGITVASDSEMSPRLALSAAPYSFNSITAVNSTYSNNSINASYATTANNSNFLGGVAAGSYALTNGNYPSMTVGTANNSNFLGGVAASSYFQNGGALTASTASIGGHTPWAYNTCSWYQNCPITSTNYTTVNCPSSTQPVAGGCITSGASIYESWANFSSPSGWICGFSAASTSTCAEVECCPS